MKERKKRNPRRWNVSISFVSLSILTTEFSSDVKRKSFFFAAMLFNNGMNSLLVIIVTPIIRSAIDKGHLY